MHIIFKFFCLDLENQNLKANSLFVHLLSSVLHKFVIHTLHEIHQTTNIQANHKLSALLAVCSFHMATVFSPALVLIKHSLT